MAGIHESTSIGISTKKEMLQKIRVIGQNELVFNPKDKLDMS
jgi:hypothetical protein